jgi:hypothetical protein
MACGIIFRKSVTVNGREEFTDSATAAKAWLLRYLGRLQYRKYPILPGHQRPNLRRNGKTPKKRHPTPDGGPNINFSIFFYPKKITPGVTVVATLLKQ